MVLRAFDGVVGAEVGVGRIRRKLDFFGARNASELFGFRAGRDVVEETFFQFGDGFGGPSASVKHVDGFAGKRKVLRNTRELHASATLHEDHRVIFGNRQEFAEVLLGGVVDGLEFGRAMRQLHDGHSCAAIIEQFFADALEDGEGQSRGSSVEIKGALQGSRRCRCAHDVEDLSMIFAVRP